MSPDDPRAACPECGNPPARLTHRTHPTHIHEHTGTCKQGHIWTTRWFADRSTHGEDPRR